LNFPEIDIMSLTNKFTGFYEYYNHLEDLIEQQTWKSAEEIGTLLSCRDLHADLKFLQVPAPEDKYYDRNAIRWSVFDDLIMLHLNVLNALSIKNWQMAFNHQKNARS
jgi:hypothetical protein